MRTFVAPDIRALTVRHELGGWLNACGLTGKGVEVGTLHGTYAQQILDSWRGHLYCVDPWQNQPKEIYHDGQNEVDLPAIFQQVSNSLGNHPRCTLLRMMSLNAVGRFDDGELDFVYLDGNHSLEAVRQDLLDWWPKIKIGGLMCGHDFFTRYDDDTNSDAQTAVNELADAIGVKPMVTWCTSWWFIKTVQADEAFRRWNLIPGAGQASRPVYTDNRDLDLVVVLPVARFDWNLAKKLAFWMERLADAAEKPEDGGWELVVYCSPALTDGQREQLDVSAYVVVADGVKEVGYFGSPNMMFKGALEYVEKHHAGKAMLWVEADAVPLRPSWVREIRDEYRSCGRPFMGDILREGPIVHMTGNGVYHPSWRTLAPSLAALNGDACGWDSLAAHDIVPRAHQAKTIQQIWRPPLPITAAWAQANIRPATALFHQCKDGSLIDVQCESLGIPKIRLDAPLCESTYDAQKHFLVPQAGPIGSVGPLKHNSSSPAASGGQIPSMEILIVTFKRDIEYLRNCLKSIGLYARKFAGVTLVVPAAQKDDFKWVNTAKVKYFDEVPGKGFLHHMAMICRADELCPDAEAVLLMDPDCMFWQPATPADFAPGGKLLLVRERYVDLAARNPNRCLWQKCVENAVGFMPDWETMVRHPQVHRREVFEKVRQLVEMRHPGQKFDEYVLSCQNEFPQTFAEHPTLGAVALRFFAEHYHAVDYSPARDAAECNVGLDGWQYLYRRDRDRIVEFWSHAPFARYASDANAFLEKRVPAYYAK